MSGADLGPQLEDYVAELVNSGRFRSKGEVLREGLRLIQDREARLSALDQSLKRGLADADDGRVQPAPAVFDRLEAKYRSQIQTKDEAR